MMKLLCVGAKNQTAEFRQVFLCETSRHTLRNSAKRMATERGLDWELMTDNDRENFVDDIIWSS